jgi:PAS domain S-box-containing protein
MDESKKTSEELRAEIERLGVRIKGLESALSQSFAAFSTLQEREERYRLMVENLPDAAWTTDSAGHTVYISPRVEEVYGYAPDEIVQTGEELWFGRIHPGDLDRVRAAFEQMMDRGSAFDLEYRIRHKNGHWIWIHDRAFVRSTKEGRRFAHGIFRDITAHKESEEALLIKDAAIASSQNAIAFGDMEGKITFVNQAFLVLWGYVRPDEVVGRRATEFWQMTDEASKTIATLHKGGGWSGELTACRKGGDLFPVQLTASLVHDAGGRPLCLMAWFLDITERKQAEEELRSEKNKTDAILAALGDGISIQDLDYKVLYQNDAHKAIVGEHVGEFCYAAYQHRGDVCKECAVAMAFRDGKVHTVERSATNEKGKVYVEVTASPLRDASGAIVAGIELVRDITQRKRAEEDRHRSQEQAHMLIDRMPLACIMWDTDFRVALWNPAAEQIFGYPAAEALGKRADEIVVPGPARSHMEDVWKRLLIGVETSHSINENRTRDGRSIVCEWYNTSIRDASGRVSFVLSMVMDVTDRERAEKERRKLEGQLLQAQKMEAIGLLAGGVAHDFNNILSAILGYASIVQMKMRPDDPLKPNVEQVLAASQRAATLTQSLLAFSRKQIINPQPLLVNESLRKIEKLLRRVIGEDIEFNTAYAEPDMTILADAGQLEQVIINLATNARDAMPRSGTISLETCRAVIDDEFIRKHGYGMSGTYAMISLADTGTGMDEKTRARIFEPFFTTKELGKGTGLGLSTAYGIVKQNNGYIICSSKPGSGTTFRIYLPFIEALPRRTAAVDSVIAARGTETVLVAEDDQTMRDLFCSLLEDHGYTVITAGDGDEAITRFRERSRDVKLIVVDVVMPKKNGREVYDEALRSRPGVKALFISGYTADIISRKGVLLEGLPFLSKPVTPDAFLKKIRDVLDGK